MTILTAIPKKYVAKYCTYYFVDIDFESNNKGKQENYTPNNDFLFHLVQYIIKLHDKIKIGFKCNWNHC